MFLKAIYAQQFVLKRTNFKLDYSNRLGRYLSIILLMMAAQIAVIQPVFARAALPDYVSLIEKHSPEVVKITTTYGGDESLKSDKNTPNLPELPEEVPEFLKRFLEQIPQQGPNPRGSGFGSGFVVSEDGYILTNHHVIEGASRIQVALQDRHEYDAEVIGSDPRSDIALIKIKAKGLQVADLGSSDSLKVGQWVMAIGAPFGFDYTATQGIISALSRSLPDGTYVPFIQTDAAVNPGNSGGPLYDLDGRVIGVNAQIYTRTGGYMGLSFAIPIDVVKGIMDQLKEKGYVSRGWLGVVIQDVTQDLAESFGLDRPHGSLVASVSPDGPADKGGITAGDIILEFDGRPVDRNGDLPPIVGVTPVGKDVKVKVLRDGKHKTLTVAVGELPDDVNKEKRRPVISKTRLGIGAEPLDDELKAELSVSKGVVVGSVEPGSPAAKAGIRAGDVLLTFNKVEIDSPKTLREVVNSAPADKSLPALISRGGNPLFMPVTLPKE